MAELETDGEIGVGLVAIDPILDGEAVSVQLPKRRVLRSAVSSGWHDAAAA